MNKIELQEIITSRFNNTFANLPNFLRKTLLYFLKKIIMIDQMNSIIFQFSERYDFDFIEDFLELLNVTYTCSHSSKQNIPSEGKLLIVANHPLGGLDGLILLKAISEIRTDVKIIANDLLMNIENLNNLFLPIDLFKQSKIKENLKKIENAFNNGEAVIIFPAAEVSRLRFLKIVDKRWSKGVIRFAEKYNVPILPVYIKSRNSFKFYLLSLLYKRISTLYLVREMFKSKNKVIHLKIGELIPTESIKGININLQEKANLLKKHVYNLGTNKRKIFKTVKNIIHPIPPAIVRNELKNSKLLGYTFDKKSIYLVEFSKAKNVIREISRLREITFRKVGEGTGKKYDMDKYDKYYKHIVLWDNDNWEIVGSYRLGIGKEIMENYGFKGFYNAELFHFSDKFENIANQSIELGRSFIQEKYWRTAALDYLWQGIGAFLREYPYIRYLFGAVSISDSYSDYAKSMIVYYYEKWFNYGSNLALAKNKYYISEQNYIEFSNIFKSNEPENDFSILKNELKRFGFTVPVLYRRYTDITEFGGTEFLDFGVDPQFSNAIDGLILVDLKLIKPEKKERYYMSKSMKNNVELV